MRLRSALLLSVLSCAVSLLFGAAMRLSSAAPLARWLLEAMVTVIAFGMTAYLGLCVLDGDQKKIVPLFQLTRGQIFWLSLLGVLAAAPMTLVSDVLAAWLSPAAQQTSGGAAGSSLFLLTLLKSALLAPVCEELFFRGYLYGALQRVGKGRAAAVSALVFALAHGLAAEAFLPRVLLGLLLALLLERTGTLLAPMLIHGCYNAAIIIIAYAGLAPLFSGLTIVSCALRLMLCLLFLYVLRRAYTTRGLKKPVAPLSELGLSKRETALAAASVLLAILAEVLA